MYRRECLLLSRIHDTVNQWMENKTAEEWERFGGGKQEMAERNVLARRDCWSSMRYHFADTSFTPQKDF